MPALNSNRFAEPQRVGNTGSNQKPIFSQLLMHAPTAADKHGVLVCPDKKLAGFLFLAAMTAFGAPPAPKGEENASQAAAFQAAIREQTKSLQQQSRVIFAQTGIKPGEDDFIPPIPDLVEADCAPLPQPEIDALIAGAARRDALDPALIRAVMRQESGFRPCAVSNKGAQGLMQLMPATSARLHVSNPFDPEQNVAAGTKFLKELLTRYSGDLRLALVAYNAGSMVADGAPADRYPAETQAYLANIFAELATPPEDAAPLGDITPPGGSSAKTHSPPPAPEPPGKSPPRQTKGSPPAALQKPVAAANPKAVRAGGA